MIMVKFNALAICLLVPAMSACATSSDISVAPASEKNAAALPALIRQNVPTEMTMQALFMGRLHRDPKGCLRGDNDGGPLILWHHDTRIARGPDGRIQIADAVTGNHVHVGDDIALSGGYRAGPVANVAEPVPPACQSHGRVFVAGRVMSEAQRRDLLARIGNRPNAPSSPTVR